MGGGARGGGGLVYTSTLCANLYVSILEVTHPEGLCTAMTAQELLHTPTHTPIHTQ